jgi:hypothetical protein
MISGIRWLQDGWNLILHQKLLHYEVGMKRHIVTVKDPIVSAFFPAFLPK